MMLSELRDALRKRIGNPDTTDVPDSDLTDEVNEAYQDIWDRYRFHANRTTDSSINTVDGTAAYNLPAGCDVIMSVKDTTNYVKLKKIGKDRYDRKTEITTGKPTEYFRQNDQIILWTTPDDVYNIRIRYKVAITVLALDADEPTIPVSWHMGIVLLARFKHWDIVGDVPKAQFAYRVWQEWVKDKSDELDDELQQDYDEAVSVPTLEQPMDRLDFDHSE